MILYRYMTAKKALDLLGTKELIFTPPKYFNDINEFSPTIDKKISKRTFFKHIYSNKEFMEELHVNVNNPNKKPFPDLYSSIKNSKKNRDKYIDFIHRANIELELRFMEIMNRSVGVICFSEIMDSPLMWAHYADSHKGICLGFEVDLIKTKSEINTIHHMKVFYNKNKVKLPVYFGFLEEDQRQMYYKYISFRKDILWKYEKEYRFLTDLNNQCKKKKGVDKNDKDKEYTIYYQTINLEDIKKIYIGARFEEYDELKRILKKNNFKPKICKMKPDTDTFNLKHEPYEVK